MRNGNGTKGVGSYPGPGRTPAGYDSQRFGNPGPSGRLRVELPEGNERRPGERCGFNIRGDFLPEKYVDPRETHISIVGPRSRPLNPHAERGGL